MFLYQFHAKTFFLLPEKVSVCLFSDHDFLQELFYKSFVFAVKD